MCPYSFLPFSDTDYSFTVQGTEPIADAQQLNHRLIYLGLPKIDVMSEAHFAV